MHCHMAEDAAKKRPATGAASETDPTAESEVEGVGAFDTLRCGGQSLISFSRFFNSLTIGNIR